MNRNQGDQQGSVQGTLWCTLHQDASSKLGNDIWQDAALKGSVSMPGSIFKQGSHTLEVVAGSQVVAGWDCRHSTAHCDQGTAQHIEPCVVLWSSARH